MNLVYVSSKERLDRASKKLKEAKEIQRAGLNQMNRHCRSLLFTLSILEEELLQINPKKEKKSTKKESFKKLFRKIAQKTHPDRTKNADSDLFIKAKKAYENEDLSSLLNIDENLFDDNYKIDFDELEKSIKKAEHEFSIIINSKVFIWASAFLKGDQDQKENALQEYKSYLKRLIDNKKQQIESLRTFLV